MSKFVRALLGAPVLFAALPAFAQEAPARPDEIVVTAERLVEEAIQRVGETPGGANVVPASDFDGKVAVSLRDALAFSPGIYTQPRFGQEVRLSIRGSGISRGYHMRGLTLLQDGVPINLADDNGDFQELDPAFLQHLEVFRGVVDGATGALTSRRDFAERHWIDRLVGYGIAAHEGALFGIVNQLLGTLTALLLATLSISGAVMWWRRRPGGLLGAPIPLSRPRCGPLLIGALVLLAAAMPLFGATLALTAICDRLLLPRWPAAQR